MMKILLAFSIGTFSLLSCNNNQKPKLNTPKFDSAITDKPVIYSDSINFKATFVPAFSETARFQILKVHSLSFIQILIYNRIPPSTDEIADTLYFLRKSITSSQFNHLDSTILQQTLKGFKEQYRGHIDGIGIDYLINYHGKINQSAFSCPLKDGYDYTIKALRIFKFMFRDSIVDNYIDEIDCYLPYSSNDIMKYDKNKPINKLRERVYGNKNRKK